MSKSFIGGEKLSQRKEVPQDTELVTQVPKNSPDNPSIDSRRLHLDKRSYAVIYRENELFQIKEEAVTFEKIYIFY